MRKLVILGAGTAGTMVANHLSKHLNKSDWQITIIDKDDDHLYQPGLLLLPFGVYKKDQLIKPRKRQVNERVNFIFSEIEKILKPLYGEDWFQKIWRTNRGSGSIKMLRSTFFAC